MSNFKASASGPKNFPRRFTSIWRSISEASLSGISQVVPRSSFARANRSSSLGGKRKQALLFVVAADLSFAVRRGQCHQTTNIAEA